MSFWEGLWSFAFRGPLFWVILGVLILVPFTLWNESRRDV